MSLRRLRLVRLEDRTVPTAGMLDPTFGTGGQVTTRFPIASGDYGTATTVDSLDRIIVAGYTENGSNRDFVVARFKPNGELDSDFGETGVVTFGFGASNDEAYGVAVDSLDRVVVVGSTRYDSINDFAVARLTVAGVLDASFDSEGKQTIDFGGPSDIAYGVAVDSQDRVVVAGIAGTYPSSDFAVARLTTTGALDNIFDGDGKQTIDFGASDDYAKAVAVDSMDRVVIAGQERSNYDCAVARLTAAGTLDSSFDGDGKQTIDFGESYESAEGVAVDSLDRVVIVGFMGNPPNSNAAAARLTAAGTLDSSFDADGRQFLAFYAASDVVVDPLDRVIVAGASYSGFAVSRLTAGGVIDNSFDGDGKQTIDFGSANSSANGVAVDSLGRVVVAGFAYNGTYDFVVGRLTPSGALDSSFDSDGKRVLGLSSRSIATGNGVAVDSFGRIVVAGYAFNGANHDFAVTRYLSTGILDSTFGGTGIVTADFSTSNDWGFSVAIDSLDRIVIAGITDNESNRDFAVARLTAAGVLDGSFDSDGKQTIDFGSSGDTVSGVAVDSLDRVVIVGYTGSYPNSDFAVARLTAAGALDGSFDGDGKQTIDFNAFDDYGEGVAIDSLDRILVVGSTRYDSIDDFAVARLTAAGALDSSFDGDGNQTIDFGAIPDYAYGVAIDSLDRVVVAGGSSGNFAVARLSTAGALDSNFDGDGKQTIDFGSSFDYALSLCTDSMDRVVVAGYTGGVPRDFAMARLTSAGALDNSFDGDGKQTIDFGGSDDIAYGVAVDSDGRIVLAGRSHFNGDVFAVARLTGDTTTASVQVNDGSAQRSMVTSFSVTFSEPVTFPSGIGSAIRLQRTGPGAPTGPVALAFNQTGNTVTVTFDDSTFAPGTAKSLIDGNYALTLVASEIQSASGALDGDGDGTPGGDLTYNFHRLFGDADGDRSVNSTDFAAFRSFFSAGSSIFDFNNNGQTGSDDFAEFRNRFGLMI